MLFNIDIHKYSVKGSQPIKCKKTCNSYKRYRCSKGLGDVRLVSRIIGEIQVEDDSIRAAAMWGNERASAFLLPQGKSSTAKASPPISKLCFPKARSTDQFDTAVESTDG